jgi:hypothetical protein
MGTLQDHECVESILVGSLDEENKALLALWAQIESCVARLLPHFAEIDKLGPARDKNWLYFASGCSEASV